MKNIVILISGEGTNLQAIIDACRANKINARICAVISNKSTAYGLQRAQQAGITTKIFLRRDYSNSEQMDLAMSHYINTLNADLIVLAGYMKILSQAFTQQFLGKIINIHPSLLPKYPGLNTYQRALENSDSQHGTTIHFVNHEVDAGAIILQIPVAISQQDDTTTLAQKVKDKELIAYPKVIKWFIDGRLCLKNENAYLDGKMLPPNGYSGD